MKPGDRFQPDDPALEELGRLSNGWGCPLRPEDPQHRLTLEVARDLRAAGFELHDCGHRAPTGGVCLTPNGHGSGVIVTWAQHDVMIAGGDLYAVCDDVQQTMNYALADVLTVLGWQVEGFGQRTAHVVVGPRERDRDAGREAGR